MLGNTPLQPVDFVVERAKSFAFSIKVQHEDGTPFDLDGSTTRCVIAAPRRFGGAVVETLTGVDVELDGVRQFRLQAVDLDREPGDYPYDITLITPQDYSVPLAKGVFTIGSNTDPSTSNTYSFADPDQWLTFTIKNGATIRTVIQNNLGLGTVWQGGVPGTLSAVMREAIQDAVAELLVAGSNITLTYNDATGQLTVAATGGGGGGGGGGGTSGYSSTYVTVYES